MYVELNVPESDENLSFEFILKSRNERIEQFPTFGTVFPKKSTNQILQSFNSSQMHDNIVCNFVIKFSILYVQMDILCFQQNKKTTVSIT